MQAALEEARAADARDEVPVGAALVHSESGAIVMRASNRSIETSDPSAHAEMLAIRALCAELGVQRLPEYDLYVTLEPCTMCAGAIAFARIRRVVFGAGDPKGGAVVNGVKFFEQDTCHHKPMEIVSGLLEEECGDILRRFFRSKR